MMNPIRTLTLALLASTTLSGSALTYYSRGNGNWNDPTRWSLIGYGGVAAATYPGQTGAGDVVFISGHTITLNITPANALGALTLNQLGTAATTKLDLNTAGTTLTCTGFSMLDNNVNQHMELEVSSTAVLQVNGAFTVTRGTTNNRDRRMRVYVRTNGRINTTGNFTYTYNRSNGENEFEILLDNSGRIDIGGNLTCTVGNNSGGNDQFTLQMNSTTQVNVTGNSTFTVQGTSDGDDMNLDLNGGVFTTAGATTWRTSATATGSSRFNVTIDGATWNANGGLTMDQQDGDTYEVHLNSNSTANAAILNVTGNATFSHTDGDDQTFDLNGNATVSITGDLTTTFSENDAIAQLFDLDGGSFTVSGSMTCTVNGGGTDHELSIELDGSAQLNVNSDLVIYDQAGNDLTLLLNSNNGTTAVLNVGRDLIIDKDPAPDDVYVDLHQSSTLGVGRDLVVRHTADNDDEFWIGLYDTPSLSVVRNVDLTMDNGNDNGDDLGIDQNGGTIMVEGDLAVTRSAGDDVYWDQDGGSAIVGGNFTITSSGGDDLEIALDGTAQATIGGNMTLDLDNGDDVLFTMNENNGSGTTISVGGDLVIDHEGPADDIDLLMNNSSTLNVGGDLLWDQSNSGGDYAYWRLDNDVNAVNVTGDVDLNLLTGTHTDDDFTYDQQGGTVTIGGSATLLHAAGDDYYCHVHNSSVFDVGGDLTFNHTGGDDFKFDQSSNASWVYVDGDVNMIDASTGGTPTEFEQDNASNSKILGDFHITAGAGGQCLVDMNNTSYMEIGGSFIRGTAPGQYGSLTSDNGATIEYDGVNNVQYLSEDAGNGGDSWDYENVVIDNTFATYPQLSTVGTTTINQALTLTNGVVYTEPTSLLVIANGSTSTSGNSGSFVDGPMKKIGSTSFTFPVGDDQVWARLRMEGMANTNWNTEFVCEYLSQPSPNNSAPFYSATIDHVSYVEYWDLDRVYDTGAPASCQVRLYWENSTYSGIVPTAIADLRVAHFSSSTSKWENQGGTASGGTTGNIVSTTALVNFSPITFGSRADLNPLPVELLAFDAHANGAIVDITWRTATELDNDHFEVERSTDGVTFTTIATVAGAGNSQEELHYATVDPAPAAGVNLYRLKQVDTDGAFTYSDVVAVNMAPGVAGDPLVYPNPGNGDLNVLLPSADGPMTFDVIDATGRLLLSERAAGNNGGVFTLRTATLPAGTYSVVVRDAAGNVGTSRWLKVGQ